MSREIRMDVDMYREDMEPDDIPFCTCPHLHGCKWMIYDINMKKRCHYHSSGETAK